MGEWLDSLAGPGYAAAVLWTLLALVALAVVLAIVRMVRGMSTATYVVGGRNRKTRLAVMDATAIDNHRRLVLVRRDDVEHLILIGGSTDIVVEQDIRISASARRAAAPGEIGEPQANHSNGAQPPRPRQPTEAPPVRTAQLPPREARVERTLPQMPAATAAAVRAAPSETPPAPERRSQEARPEPPRPSRAAPAAAARPAPPPVRPVAPAPTRDDLDSQLMKELEVSLEPSEPRPLPQQPPAPVSLDDEMARLLGELSSKR